MEKPKTVLVVDDDAHIRRVIELKLKNQGYQVILGKNGEEGLNLIQTQSPDVLIVDLNMPKMDGKKLCEMCDELKQKRSFLTIVITARISLDEQVWIDNLHDTLFMEKPFSPAKMVAAIKEYFKAQG